MPADVSHLVQLALSPSSSPHTPRASFAESTKWADAGSRRGQLTARSLKESVGGLREARRRRDRGAWISSEDGSRAGKASWPQAGRNLTYV